ncbi:t-SNARE affecting a late Golgi compartment protein 2 [Malassezia equina]|uniref:t-SNARE affecting a late Golgi compartment protein 2 n=1 Tax=Malassezia equina TaxID=1381935 RepID=A0AAF0EDS4_9BASI|nr:t-SNARE affecting a late Golgi compartment protein 2 [Malassezia equina]
MLRATLALGASVRTPMIRFPDRKAPKPKHEPKPHPDAPADIQNDFSRFREVLESGPHFDASKLKPFSLSDFEPKPAAKSSSGGAKEAVDQIFDLPARYWNTPSLRFSEAEMDAIQWPATPPAYASSTVSGPPHLGVTRSRTLLFLSIRDSLAPATHGNALSTPLLHDAPSSEAVYFDDVRDEVALDVSLPPIWVDATEQVDMILNAMIPKLAQLDRLHSQHLLPSFDDKSDQKRVIEDLTDDITRDFRRASEQVAKLAKQTTEMLRSERLSKPEVTAARNAQTALATRVQHMSSVFRQKQSTYLRKLQGMEIQEPKKTATWLLNDEESVQDDVALVSTQWQQSEQALINTNDGLQEIQERDREVQQIATSITELAQLFQDLNVLVIEQGSMLDRIDYNIDSMATDMQQSSAELGRAMHYQAGAGRRALILLLLLCIALVIAILLIRPFFR